MSRPARLVAALLCLGLVALGATVAGLRLGRTPPAPALSLRLAPALDSGTGPPVPVTMPGQGSLDLEADPGGVLAALDADVVRQIGSVAKTMTALVVLEAHPLSPGAAGPVLTMTQADVDLYRQGLAEGGSVVPVAAGEQLSERDVLLALLLPSANNLAETLARWVSGGRDAFVARLNATALRLGMSHTHFDDPSGFSDQTVSTAADLVRLGRAALAVPALAELVHTPSASLPDGTALTNLDALLTSVPGWLGIKTGETRLAGGCLLFADRAAPPGATGTGPAVEVTVVGAILGQPHLAEALSGARSAVTSALGGYALVDAAQVVPTVTGGLSSAWGDAAAVRVEAQASGGRLPAFAVRRGQTLSLRARPSDLSAPIADGQAVAEIEGLSGDRVVARWEVRADGAVPEPSAWWRLLHG